VTPFPDPNVRNLKNSKAQNVQQARQKIEEIAGRLKRGEDFAMLAQSFSEDVNTAPNGGDLGFIPESSLEKTSPELRNAVVSLQPGAVSPIIQTPDGFRILKLVSREPAGQRELGDPRVQQDIRDRLINRKEQLLKNAYLEMARNEAQVSNYFAQRIVAAARAK
jgi:peptidyl-prolyl cis-trans isomerase SurA